jgi:hypothetical protein
MAALWQQTTFFFCFTSRGSRHVAMCLKLFVSVNFLMLPLFRHEYSYKVIQSVPHSSGAYVSILSFIIFDFCNWFGYPWSSGHAAGTPGPDSQTELLACQYVSRSSSFSYLTHNTGLIAARVVFLIRMVMSTTRGNPAMTTTKAGLETLPREASEAVVCFFFSLCYV